jgi:hypothetical protein
LQQIDEKKSEKSSIAVADSIALQIDELKKHMTVAVDEFGEEVWCSPH